MTARFIQSSKARVKAMFRRNRKSPVQLEMIWPGLPAPSVPDLPAGFVLRTYHDSDEAGYRDLVERTFGHRFELEYWLDRTVSGGLFIVEDIVSGSIAATCMASHHPMVRNPDGGNLGWLATDPKYRGRGLGTIVSAAVTKILIDGEFREINLHTDDYRLSAIAIYLRLGWKPNCFSKVMSERWNRVTMQLAHRM